MKKILEEAREYANEYWKDEKEQINMEESVLHTMIHFTDGVNFAQRWIPIEQELPEVTDLVLLKDEFGFWDKGCMIYDDGERKFLALGLMGKIVKWRPINIK